MDSIPRMEDKKEKRIAWDWGKQKWEVKTGVEFLGRFWKQMAMVAQQ